MTNTEFHSIECTKLIPRPFPKMSELDDMEQGYILRCSHSAHDSVRQFMGFKPQLDASTNQLVRIHA